MSDERKRPSWRARMIAALAGAVLAASCYCVPPDYQTVCALVAKIAGSACGGF